MLKHVCCGDYVVCLFHWPHADLNFCMNHHLVNASFWSIHVASLEAYESHRHGIRDLFHFRRVMRGFSAFCSSWPWFSIAALLSLWLREKPISRPSCVKLLSAQGLCFFFAGMEYIFSWPDLMSVKDESVLDLTLDKAYLSIIIYNWTTVKNNSGEG